MGTRSSTLMNCSSSEWSAWDRAHLFHVIKESVLFWRVENKSSVEPNDMSELILTEFLVMNDTTQHHYV